MMYMTNNLLSPLDARPPEPTDYVGFDAVAGVVLRVDPPSGFGYDLAMMECGHQLAVITHQTPKTQIIDGSFPCIRCGRREALTAEAVEILASSELF